MSAASDYLEDALLDHVLGGTTYTQPSNVYLGLWTADDGLEAGTQTSEVSGNGYSRVAITFGAASDGDAANSAAITFAAASGGAWGTITHVAVMDADESGNVLFHGAVTTSKTIADGDQFSIAIGNLTISLA